MILKTLCLFLQNICKNRILTDIILENKKDFDIIFIQEHPWSFIYTISSFSNKKENKAVDISNHLD